MITTGNLDFAPSWSPLGDKIAFCSGRSGQVDVWMVNSDGSGSPQQISHNVLLQGMSYETEDCYLRWSPDGAKIAFTGVTADIPYASIYNVYTMNSTDGSNVTQLTNCQINNPYPSVCSTPSWSPDGSKIAFGDGNAIDGDNIGGAGIYIMDPNGANITPRFQDNNAISAFPHWSTDGKKIIFTYAPSAVLGVYWIKPDGSTYPPAQIIGGGHHFTYQPFGIDCSRCERFDQ